MYRDKTGKMSEKKFLFILSQSPHDGLWTQETLDIILTVAAFDQPVSLLFLDQGVFQIKNHQNPDLINTKNTAAIFEALEIYDIHDIFSEVESLQEYGLKPGDLFLPVKEIYRKEVSLFISKFDMVCGN